MYINKYIPMHKLEVAESGGLQDTALIGDATPGMQVSADPHP